MDNNIKLTLDVAPFFSELFKTQAYVRTLASVLLTPEQKEEFNKSFNANYKELIKDFIEVFPDLLSDTEELRKILGMDK